MELIVKKFNELTNGELYDILKARVDIFIVEQNCPYPDIDGNDKDAVHVFLRDNNEIKAYLRVLDKGVMSECPALGRVFSTERRRGYASQVLVKGIEVAKEYFGAQSIYVEAQTYARSLYEKQGFRQISEEFLEDGIPHIKMLLEL